VKGFCYIVLILGFFIFYQQNPVYSIIIIVLFIGVYLFFKSRSSGSSKGVFGFFSGKNAQQGNRMEDLITLMVIQQLMNTSSQNNDYTNKNDEKAEKDKQIDKIKQDILDLLEEN